MKSSHELIKQIERLIRRDPARRGLIGTESMFAPLCVGHLAEFGARVAIVTGFFVPHAQPPAAETDGPLGAVLLATALTQAGMETVILTDEYCFGALLAASDAAGYPTKRVLAYSDDSLNTFYNDGFGTRTTHLIAIERVGPSHSLDSLKRQLRQADPGVSTARPGRGPRPLS